MMIVSRFTSGRLFLIGSSAAFNNLIIVGEAPSVIGIRPAVSLDSLSNNSRRRFAYPGEL
jgi:hypothetical protein